MITKSSQKFLCLSLLMMLLMAAPYHLLARSMATPSTAAACAYPSDEEDCAVFPSTGRASNTTKQISSPAPRSTSSWPIGAAFVLEIYPDEYIRYIPNTNDPQKWITVESIADTAYYAGDFVGRNFRQIYVLDYNLNQLHTLDTRSGTDATIGATVPLAGQVWTGATGTADGRLYASSTDGISSHLYTVDTTTGTTTLVGKITNATTIIDIAISGDGRMYGVDITSDDLVQIDPETGEGTVIGGIGFNADYAQGMDFDELSNILYLAAYNVTTARGELRTADITTGNTTLIAAFPNNAQTDVLAFTPPPTQLLPNAGFESGWDHWSTESGPYLSDAAHSGSWSVNLSGKECWAWQVVYIPADALEVSFGYWVTGVSADSDWTTIFLLAVSGTHLAKQNMLMCATA